jgi:hypothetical protein
MGVVHRRARGQQKHPLPMRAIAPGHTHARAHAHTRAREVCAHIVVEAIDCAMIDAEVLAYATHLM